MAKVSKKKVAVGLGLVAAAAGAGYYFLGSKNASKHREKTTKWAKDMKNDVVKKAKAAKKLDERAYRAIVDEAMRAYVTMKSIDRKDVQAAANELKEGWGHVKQEVSRAAKTGTRAVKKSVKKVAKSKGGKK